MRNTKLSETANETEWLSLDEYVSPNADETLLYVRVRGLETGCGIADGDLLVVVKGETPKDDDIVLKSLNGRHIVARYKSEFRRGLRLVTDKPHRPFENVEIVGVVSFILKQV